MQQELNEQQDRDVDDSVVCTSCGFTIAYGDEPMFDEYDAPYHSKCLSKLSSQERVVDD